MPTVGAFDAVTDGQQLDHCSHLAGRRDVTGGDVADALPVHVRSRDPGVEGQPGEDRRLGSGVETFDVGGRVGFGVAERLCLLECVVEARTRAVHLVEDVVGRAVHDAEDPADPVAGQGLSQRSDDRDRTGDGRLEVDVAGDLGGGLEQRRTVLGEQSLVSGHHRCAGLQRCDDERPRGLDPADHFDDDVDVAPGDQRVGVGREQLAWKVDVTGSIDPAYGDARPARAARPPERRDRWPARWSSLATSLPTTPHPSRATRTGWFMAAFLVRGSSPAPTSVPVSWHVADWRRRIRDARHQPSRTSSRSRSSSVSRRTTNLAWPRRTATTAARGTWL